LGLNRLAQFRINEAREGYHKVFLWLDVQEYLGAGHNATTSGGGNLIFPGTLQFPQLV
jgi:hypothetical protein